MSLPVQTTSESRAEKPTPEQSESARGLRHWLIVMIVFGITGFSALVFSRVLLNMILGMDGSIWSGPWSYRIVYLAVIPPFYYAMLILVGSVFGKREFFMRRTVKVWSRLVPSRIRR